MSIINFFLVSGELILILEDGTEKLLKKPGDIVIQKGTIHAWRNPSKNEWTRMVNVLIAAEPAVVEGKQLPPVVQWSKYQKLERAGASVANRTLIYIVYICQSETPRRMDTITSNYIAAACKCRTSRHAYLKRWLRLPKVVVCINMGGIKGNSMPRVLQPMSVILNTNTRGRMLKCVPESRLSKPLLELVKVVFCSESSAMSLA